MIKEELLKEIESLDDKDTVVIEVYNKPVNEGLYEFYVDTSHIRKDNGDDGSKGEIRLSLIDGDEEG